MTPKPEQTTAAGKPGAISCHTCGAQVAVVRSVRLRQCVSWRPDPNVIDDQNHRAHLQYARNMQFRRAFICQACYAVLASNGYGVGAVRTTTGETKEYNLSGESRGDKAAVYDYAKWLRYQKRTAGKMGLGFDG